MNNKLICPFCGEEIISDLCLMCDKIDEGYTSGRQIYKCNKCSLFGNKEMWQALIQAKQDLKRAEDMIIDLNTVQETTSAKCAQSQKSAEIARQALEELWRATHYDTNGYLGRTISQALEQIEHKE